MPSGIAYDAYPLLWLNGKYKTSYALQAFSASMHRCVALLLPLSLLPQSHTHLD